MGDEMRKCQLCIEVGETIEAIYDAKTILGCWADLCEVHMRSHGVGLGLGKGQRIAKVADASNWWQDYDLDNPDHPEEVHFGDSCVMGSEFLEKNLRMREKTIKDSQGNGLDEFRDACTRASHEGARLANIK